MFAASVAVTLALPAAAPPRGPVLRLTDRKTKQPVVLVVRRGIAILHSGIAILRL